MSLFNSLQAEQAVLGSLMMDNSTFDVISDKITEHDFCQRNHKLIFKVISKLAESAQPFDIITIGDELKTTGELDSVGGFPYLCMLIDDTPTSSNIVAYAGIVAKKSLRRRVNKATVEMNDMAQSMAVDNDELLEKVEQCVSEITTGGVDKIETVAIKSSLAAMVERIEQRYERGDVMTGIPTGLIDLDKITNGLQRKDLIILAARPSIGKTAVMMRFVEAAALQESRPNILIFSIEMPEEKLTERMTASVGRIDSDKIKTGAFEDSDWARLTSALSILAGTNIHYCDDSTITLAGMRTVIRRIEREHGKLAMVAVDYLQLISEKGENETLKMGKISTGLKRIAKDFDVPVLALSQLNRGLESRADKRPMMSDLRQSGQIEQDADVIMFLYRDSVYNKESADAGIMEIIVGKHRNGETGAVRAYYEGKYTRVDNLQHSREDY